jgi:hypothetical protein
MKLGAEPKKIVILVALLLIAAYFLYSNLSSSPAPGNSQRASHPSVSDVAPQPVVGVPATTAVSRTESLRRGASQEFRPSFKHKGGIDPNTIDPKLRLDLLAKVQSVEVAPAVRNLFQFGAVAVPALPAGAGMKNGKIIPGPKLPLVAGGGSSAGDPPPPPPIPLKYYGYTAKRADGLKRAFFLDGEDIFVAAEGDLIKKRYRVVHIGTNSVEVEDTQFNHKQPLPLAEEAPG